MHHLYMGFVLYEFLIFEIYGKKRLPLRSICIAKDDPEGREARKKRLFLLVEDRNGGGGAEGVEKRREFY